MRSNPANINEKTSRYMVMLEQAIEKIEVTIEEKSYLGKVAKDYMNMAQSYYLDGVHFIETEDKVNALVCFSYGHAWLDAGIRLGVFKANDETLFAI